MANIHEHAVLSDVLVPEGSGFTAHHGDDFLMANNAQWIGFSLEIGPDGALYVLDWHDARHLRTGRAAQGDRPHLPHRAEGVAGGAVGGPLRRSADDDRRAAGAICRPAAATGMRAAPG